MVEAASQEGGSGSLDGPQPPQPEPQRQQQEQGQKQEPGFEQGAAGAGGQSSAEVDDSVEAAAEKSEAQAMKVQ